MTNWKKWMMIVPNGRWCGTITLAGCLALSGIVAGQNLPPGVSTPLPQLPISPGALLSSQPTPAYKLSNRQQASGHATPAPTELAKMPVGPQVITLEEVQQKVAASDTNPMVRLGQLQIEVARQTLLGTKATFFPQIGSMFSNFHFNKFMGEKLEVVGPLGNARSIGLPLVGQNQTLVTVTATQPITPLFQLRELYKINLADERIARAKAGMP